MDTSWGIMIEQGVDYVLVAPHLVLIPRATVVLVVLPLNVKGDALHDRLNVPNGVDDGARSDHGRSAGTGSDGRRA